jgi:hypothetical protein
MVDGTGMCGGCRVSVGGETATPASTGPEFDGHQVDFDLLADRLGPRTDLRAGGERAPPAPARVPDPPGTGRIGGGTMTDRVRS